MGCPAKKCKELCLSIAACKINILEVWGYSILAVVIRLWMASIFWKSGLTKVEVTSIAGVEVPLPFILQDTYDLFEYEYNVPLLPVVVATVLATATEVIASIMLAIGFGARIAAFAFICMTVVIQFTYQMHDAHYMWMMLLGIILTLGAGRFSIDHFIRKNMLDSVCKR